MERFFTVRSVDLFEKLAFSTWQRIFYAKKYKIPQGEETITDLNLLEIAMAKCSEVQVIKTDKYKEKTQGTDWEWWIGNNRIGYLRYAVQAKKIHQDFLNYKTLKHKVGSEQQIDILERYARNNRAIPLYCFYNYSEYTRPILSGYWHCNSPLESEQLGCTITPLRNVQEALQERGRKKFDFLHKLHDTKPWRCLVYCPSLLQVYKSGTSINTSWGFGNVEVYPRLPRELSEAIDFSLNTDEKTVESGLFEVQFDNFSNDFYSEIYPKRILVANYLGENI